MINFRIRDELIDGHGPWTWPNEDTGAWDGPKDDWQYHKKALSYLKEKRVVIQAGGCCGMYPILLTDHFDYVITFEPDEENFEFLCENIKNVDFIAAYKHALGNENKNVSMSRFSPSNVGMHKVDDKEGDVKMIRLDTLFPSIQIVDLMWFDLEGYEIHALRGAVEIIKRCKPAIGIERPTQEVLAFMKEMEYSPFFNSQMDVFFMDNESYKALEESEKTDV